MDEFQDTNGQQAKLHRTDTPARPFLRRGRHQSIHLRLPPRRTGRLHRLPRRRHSARPPPRSTGGQLPQPRRDPARRGNRHRGHAGNRRSPPGGRAANSTTRPDYSVEVIAAPDLAVEAQSVARRILEFTGFRLPGHRRAGAQHRSDSRVHRRVRRRRHSLRGESRPWLLRQPRSQRPHPSAARHRQPARRDFSSPSCCVRRWSTSPTRRCSASR